MDDKINFHELEKRLITLNGKINTIEEIEKHRGTKFNIFSILDMERREVDTHSYFIYELINPEGSHFQGSKYLDIFIKTVLKIKDFELEGAKVRRETLTDTSRRIDFTIENDTYYVAIEMKVDAGDQYKQLFDYYHFAKKSNKTVKLYYLTLDGREASEKSLCGVEGCKSISFANHMIDFLELSIEKSASLPIIRESLIQYKHLIEKITNQSSEEIKMEVAKMIDNPEMAQAANEMSNSLSYVWALREVEFWKKLVAKFDKDDLNEKGWELGLEFDEERDSFDNQEENIAEWISTLAKRDIRGIYFEKKSFFIGVYSYCNGFDYRLGADKKNELKKLSEITGINKNTSDATSQKELPSKYSYSFCANSKNPTYDIFDDNKVDNIVANIFNETLGFLEKL